MNPTTISRGARRSLPAIAWLVGLTMVAPPMALAGGDEPKEGEGSQEATPTAVARFEGQAAPGRRITLKADRSTGSGLHYRWTQTQGAAVELDGADKPEASLVVPESDAPLGFLLIVGNGRGVASDNVSIPLALGRPTRRDLTPKAIAVGDRAGRVGKPVTLDGSRSEPKGQVVYRWIQASGPAITKKLEDGGYYTFVPPQPGVYFFALVVASPEMISEPSYLTVEVGTADAAVGRMTPAIPPPADAAPPPDPTAELARRALLAMPDGPEKAEDLARVFEDVATRMDLYESYQEAHSEMARRLDQLIPKEEADRTEWITHVFNPLTLRMIDSVRGEGLDLSKPTGQKARLRPGSRKILSDHFHAMAEGFGRAADRPNVSRRPDGRTDR